MPLTFFTLVLDGEPWIERHYPVFKSLDLDWRWVICEGVAANTNCTSWCAKIPPRLSQDGTHEYLEKLQEEDRRVIVLTKPLWEGGKVEMCNVAIQYAEPGLIWQVDSDELWTKKQIEDVAKLFEQNPIKNCADFFCRYFVGTARYIGNRGGFGNHEAYEWRRVWRFQPGMRFKTHEPPVIEGVERCPFTHQETEAVGAVFDHMAYSTRKSMEFRAQYYAGTANPNAHLWRFCVEGWDRLQKADLPCKLKDFFPWVDSLATVVKL